MKETELAELEEATISWLLIISLVDFPGLGVNKEPSNVRILPAPKEIVEERSVVIMGVAASVKVNSQLGAVQVPSSETR